MSTTRRVPTAVLSQRLSEVIAGRRVRAGLFTTFSFDPAFFELHVLPLLFNQTFGQPDKLRRIQLEDALRSVEHLAVYYDRRALARDAEPAQLDYRRIDVRRAQGCFHPKLILLLVDDPTGAEPDDEFPASFPSLIVGVLSANLTRAGWWENLECAHFEEIKDRDWRDVRLGKRSRPRRCPFRRDLLSLLQRISTTVDPGEDQGALARVHDFLRRRTVRKSFTKQRSGHRLHTRLFGGVGRESLADWLGQLPLYAGWNLEVISPFFDSADAGPLADLIDVLGPKEVRVYLPRDLDGRAMVTAKTYDAIDQIATWAELDPDLLQRGRDSSSAKLPPRHVHAKVYRLWHRDEADLLLVGSVNLTSSAHSGPHAGNLEAAFMIDVRAARLPRRWWLETHEERPSEFMEHLPAEEDGLESVALDLSLKFDWATKQLSFRLMDEGVKRFRVLETSGRPLFSVTAPSVGGWHPCSPEAAAAMADLLRATSFVLIDHDRGQWRILVREENMAYRPSLLLDLTPEEILEYWSLLTPDQRAAYLTQRVVEITEHEIEVLRPGLGDRHNTLFDRFAGIYHAFHCLYDHVRNAIEEGREHEAEARLLGAKYDSLPMLLEKTLAQVDQDPILCYVTFLCARQLHRRIYRRYPDFLRQHRRPGKRLKDLLEKVAEVRAALPLDEIDGGIEFLDWYEKAFLRWVAAQPASAEEESA